MAYPLEESVDWKDATSLAVRLPKHRQPRDCLGLGIGRLTSARRILAPVRNQSLAQRVERHLAGLMIAPDDQEIVAGRGVPSQRIIANPAALDKRVSQGPAALNDTSALV
jgi:hypothetical protein